MRIPTTTRPLWIAASVAVIAGLAVVAELGHGGDTGLTRLSGDTGRVDVVDANDFGGCHFWRSLDVDRLRALCPLTPPSIAHPGTKKSRF